MCDVAMEGHDDHKGRDDARTLTDAARIHHEPGRMKAARKHLEHARMALEHIESRKPKRGKRRDRMRD